MSITNPTIFTAFRIAGIDRSSDILRLETWRAVNSVGNWKAILRNVGGKYTTGMGGFAGFDVQDSFVASVNNVLNVLMTGVIDGPAVNLIARDLESDWDEYAELRGLDLGQDLLFHNDLDYDYPDNTLMLHEILHDVINTRLLGLTNILYPDPALRVPPLVWSPTVGSSTFKEGGSFLGSIQELMRRAGYVFYIDDLYELQTGAPGFDATAFVARSIAGDPTNNILGDISLHEKDGDKHYNYVKLYGKNPLFDAYTELNASDWTAFLTPNPIDYPFPMVGTYSQVTANNNPVDSMLYHVLTCPVYNYVTWNFSKGEIGFWGRYDNTAGAPGAPGAGTAPANLRVSCRLTDNAGTVVEYFGDNTRLYENEWGYCTCPLGERLATMALTENQWSLIIGGPDFDWSNVVKVAIFESWDGGATYASHFYLDGLSLPIPPIAVAPTPAPFIGEPLTYPIARTAQGIYRRRPYVDSWSHIRTQHAIQRAADTVLSQSVSTFIDLTSFVVPGNPLLKYAGQTITVDVPSLGMNNELFYTTSIHHIVEPYSDVSGGYGFDWVTEVEAAPIGGIAFDHSRLSRGPLYAAYQRGDRAGIGLGMK